MLLDDDDLRRRLGAPDLTWRTRSDLRDAAVLLPIVRRAGRDVLVFTLRQPDLAAHAGQISFPGGGREGVEDPYVCALRETEEEIGLSPGGVEPIGRLPDRISIAGYLVAAFVARVREAPPWRPLASEVAEVFELPVGGMLDPARWEFRASTHPRASGMRIPYLALDDRVVWGLTGIILGDFVRAGLDFDPGAAR